MGTRPLGAGTGCRHLTAGCRAVTLAAVPRRLILLACRSFVLPNLWPSIQPQSRGLCSCLNVVKTVLDACSV